MHSFSLTLFSVRAKKMLKTWFELKIKSYPCVRQDFREAVGAAVGDEGEPVLEEERLREILNELPDVYTLHRRILNELENRLRHWWELIVQCRHESNQLETQIDTLVNGGLLLCPRCQGGEPEDRRHLLVQEGRVFSFYHLHRPLRPQHESAGGQLSHIARLRCHCSPVWGQLEWLWKKCSQA